jgi:3-phosphoshikimate 1-carboxyvinyltransferase
MSILIIEGGRELQGEVIAPPDKSITHRALFFAALGEGACTIAPLGGGRDNRATVGAMRALGVDIAIDGSTARVIGAGSPKNLREPACPIDCMNSGTTMRVLSGILAASSIKATLTGDESLTQRPMSRLKPLTEMGAKISGREEAGKIYPPITIEGAPLTGMEHHLAVASAQVKTALILAGLWSKGQSTIYEPMRSRDHTERMLRSYGAPVSEHGSAIIVDPIQQPWRIENIDIAPDLSSAAFFLGAALTTNSKKLTIETGVNPTRAGILDALTQMNATITRRELPDRGGEPVARLSIAHDTLKAITIEKESTLRAIDEIPLLAGLALFAEGTTHIRDAEELRVKESDRLKATRAMLEAFGAKVQETQDGLIIEGSAQLKAADVDAAGDHRIAMTAAVVALGVHGTTRIRGAEHIEVSFPGFVDLLNTLGAHAQVK